MFLATFWSSRAERVAAEAALTAARARSDAARVAVVAAQTAAEAVETLIAERALSDEGMPTGANSTLWMIWHGPVSIRRTAAHLANTMASREIAA